MALKQPRTTQTNRLKRLIQFWRSRGTLTGVYLIGRRLVQRLPTQKVKLCMSEVFEVDVDELKTHSRIPNAYRVRQAKPEDLPAMEDFFTGSSAGLIWRRMNRGDVCVLAESAGRIRAAVWYTIGPNSFHEDSEALGCDFQVTRQSCLTYDGRGKKFGAWGSLMGRLPTYFQEHGIKTIYTIIDCDNRISVDSHRSLNYRSVGRILHIGLGRASLVLYRGMKNRWKRIPGRIGHLSITAINARRKESAIHPRRASASKEIVGKVESCG